VANFPVLGWLPAEVHFDRQPAIVPEGRVRWVEVGARRLSEPFLEQTFDNLRDATPPAKSAPANNAVEGGAAASKFCPECGAKVAATAKFCPKCGAKIQ